MIFDKNVRKGALALIKNVFLDLDDTLLDFTRAEAEAIRGAFVEVGISPTEENVRLYSKINRSCWERLELGELTRDEVLHTRFDILFRTLGISGNSHATQRIYEHRLSLGAYYLDGAEELLRSLVGEYRLYIATNGIVNVQMPRLEKTGITKYFDGVFISEHIGYNKPDIRFFDSCFASIGNAERCESVIVGDSLTSDIKGGKAAGIKTVWFNPKRKENATGIIPDYEIHAHHELITLLKEM